MRIVVHLTTSSAIPSGLVAVLSAVAPGGEARPRDDGGGFDWIAEVPRGENGFELEVQRRVLEVGEALHHAAPAGAVVQIEIEIARADRMHMTSHVGLSFGPDLLARLGAWGIALSVSSDAT